MKKIILSIAVLASFLLMNCGSNDASTKSESTSTPQQLASAGELIFKQYCKMCHATSSAESSGMAPMLDSVRIHWPDKKELGAYIKNAPENMDANAHISAVYAQWKEKPQMPPFTGLSADEVNQLVEYLYSIGQ
jgi:mono/diheme cytochrome c family protein